MRSVLQRKCGCGGACGGCAQKNKLRRSATGPAAHEHVPPIVHDVVRSAGRPLDPASRAFFEPRFQHDFSRVRVHADGRAADSASAVQARAYTLGSSIVFGANAYAPQTDHGRHLLAHELTHVVQQNDHAIHRDAIIGAENTSEERQADAVADRIASGGFVQVNPGQGSGVMQRAMVCSRGIDPLGLANHAYIDDTGRNDCLGNGALRNYGLFPHAGSGLRGCASKTDHSPDPSGRTPNVKPCTPRPGVTDVSACLAAAYASYTDPSFYSNVGAVAGAGLGLVGGGVLGLGAGAAIGGRVNGPNSNTFAATLARACCEDASSTGLGWVPGWEQAPATPCPGAAVSVAQNAGAAGQTGAPEATG
jgi:hypothetical protein